MHGLSSQFRNSMPICNHFLLFSPVFLPNLSILDTQYTGHLSRMYASATSVSTNATARPTLGSDRASNQRLHSRLHERIFYENCIFLRPPIEWKLDHRIKAEMCVTVEMVAFHIGPTTGTVIMKMLLCLFCGQAPVLAGKSLIARRADKMSLRTLHSIFLLVPFAD